MLCSKCKKNLCPPYSYYCKSCRSEYNSKWTKEHPEYIRGWRKSSKAKEYHKEYRKTHPRKYTKLLPIVYAYFDEEGTCVYVGRGTINRALTHKYISPWWNKNLTLLSMTCTNEWEAMEYEGKWGGRYFPTMNKEGYRHGG
jgi:hypothetical protein